MPKRLLQYLLPLTVVLLLSACSFSGGPSGAGGKNGALTWVSWDGYENFRDLITETYPDIELEYDAYAGANRTGYSWAQMRAGDIPDIFITAQILDEALASRQLVDLSGYPFISGLSTSILDQVSIDGGIYLLPVNFAMYGTFYNKTLMEEHGWALPTNFAELEALCGEIRKEGLIPGVLGTQLTGNAFSTVFNLAKTGWLTTPDGVNWERDFLAGKATAAGKWEGTMDYVQKLIDLGMFTTDPEDGSNPHMVLDYLGKRKAVFCTAVLTVNITQLPETGDELGMMPFISQDGSKNIYMYSPTSYIGLNRRLTEPGNEEKLEKAIRVLSLLYSHKGQAAFITEETPCLISLLNTPVAPQNALISDARQALRQGRAFPMTYANWDGVLSDMGQVFKEWFRGENGMDGPTAIARMDELQSSYLNSSERLSFCQSTADFTLEETAQLLGKALGSAVGADAVLVPVGSSYQTGTALRACATGKLYRGAIDTGTAHTILPTYDGEYALADMTGAQIKELAQTGFDTGNGAAFPYVLVTRGNAELSDEARYQTAFLMEGYTEAVSQAYGLRTEKGSIRAFLRNWLEQQKTVSPGGNPWS